MGGGGVVSPEKVCNLVNVRVGVCVWGGGGGQNKRSVKNSW